MDLLFSSSTDTSSVFLVKKVTGRHTAGGDNLGLQTLLLYNIYCTKLLYFTEVGSMLTD
jgi:hypothetical protein